MTSTNTNTRTAALGNLAVGDWFALDGRDHRVVWHWSAGVEVIEAASWGAAEKRVLSPATVVETA